MEKTFRQELKEFNKTDLYLYKVVTAQEVDYAIRFWDIDLNEDEYEIVCDFIYDWFTATSASIQEICENFFRELTNGAFTIQDIENDYDKVEEIINDSF